MIHRPSKLAFAYLKNLQGIEIGGSAHNPFHLNTRNVDFAGDDQTIFKQEERAQCGEALKVDIVARGDQLPLPDDSQDFVVSSHVIEHFFDPIAAIQEWIRVTRPGGYVFMIVPHRERTFDRDRPVTSLQEILDRHSGKIPAPTWNSHEHYSVWDTNTFLELCRHLKLNVIEHQNVDDKVGNGFTVLIKKAGVLPHESGLQPVLRLSRLAGRFQRKAIDVVRTFKMRHPL